MKEIFTQSETMSKEYCCSIVRIKELTPIVNSDFLATTLVNGFQIVVRKDSVKAGDLMFYAANETELDEKFLSVNNLYDLSNIEKNANYEEVKQLLSKKETATEEEKNEIDKKIAEMRGFFTHQNRVKMITLRKQPSYGFLFSKEAMEKYCPAVKNINLEDYISADNEYYDFDTVDGKLFVKAYVPHVQEFKNKKLSKEEKRAKRIEKANRIVENQFVFHYDTQQLNKNMHRFTPDTYVYISVKMHGTSFIMGNLKVRELKKYSGFLGKFKTFINEKILPNKIKKYNIKYDDIYSSRSVIKNAYGDERDSQKVGYYSKDIWGDYQKLLKGLIPKGVTIYGEIVGYLTDSETMIQKDYDYGCKTGKNKLMIYRVTSEEDNGCKKEWEIGEVIAFTKELIKEHKLEDYVMPLPLLYQGPLKELYPSIPIDEYWSENVLEALKKEEKFGMEQNEPMCMKKVPREGIVLRIAGDPLKEAFKLKCDKFFGRESKLIDAGEVDIETVDRY